MVLVAVAGGSSPTLGKSIVQAILATNKHKVVILSRPTSNSNQTNDNKQSKYGAPIHEVDYTSVDSLTNALRGVDTLISVTKINDSARMVEAHKNMLEACKASQTSRFIMSDWSMSTGSHAKVDLLAHKADLLTLCEQANQSPDSDVSCSTIQVGMFMNYFAQGASSTKIDSGASDEELTGGLVDDLMLSYIDISNKRLLIPTDTSGEPVTVSTTHLLDVGSIVAASLQLPATNMRGALGLVSQATTLAHVRDVLEMQCGVQIPYERTTAEECGRRADELGAQLQQGFDLQVFKERMVAQMYGFQCEGAEGGAVVPPTLNWMLEDAGIEVQLRSVEDMLVKAWGKN